MPPEPTPAEMVVVARQQRLRERRDELHTWVETYDRTRHSPGQLKGWAEEMERIDFALNEMGHVRAALRELPATVPAIIPCCEA